MADGGGLFTIRRCSKLIQTTPESLTENRSNLPKSRRVQILDQTLNHSELFLDFKKIGNSN